LRSRSPKCFGLFNRAPNEQISIDPLKHDPAGVHDLSGCNAQAGTAGISTEVEMKVNQVSVLVSKKIGKNFCSWSLSYGTTARLCYEALVALGNHVEGLIWVSASG